MMICAVLNIKCLTYFSSSFINELFRVKDGEDIILQNKDKEAIIKNCALVLWSFMKRKKCDRFFNHDFCLH